MCCFRYTPHKTFSKVLILFDLYNTDNKSKSNSLISAMIIIAYLKLSFIEVYEEMMCSCVYFQVLRKYRKTSRSLQRRIH